MPTLGFWKMRYWGISAFRGFPATRLRRAQQGLAMTYFMVRKISAMPFRFLVKFAMFQKR